jgi:dihydrofolate reductase
MGKIVSNFFISLDSVVEAPDQWHFPYWNDEMERSVARGLESTGALLMGRVLYDEWAAYWPASNDEPIASMFNGMEKYVVSNTLARADWSNTTIVNGDVARTRRDLKQRIEGDISISGSATLVRWLLANEILDELRLLVHPIAVGKGQRLFEDTPTHRLGLVSAETFSTGVLDLVYIPAPA